MCNASTVISIHLQEKPLARHLTHVAWLDVPWNSLMLAWQMNTIDWGLITTLDLNLEKEKAKKYQRPTQPTYAMTKVSDKSSNGE